MVRDTFEPTPENIVEGDGRGSMKISGNRGISHWSRWGKSMEEKVPGRESQYGWRGIKKEKGS